MPNSDPKELIGPAAVTVLRVSVFGVVLRMGIWAAVSIGAAACMFQHGSNASSAVPEAESIDAGLAYAKQTCSSCHAVGSGENQSPNPSAPAFQTVANTPGMTRMALNAWLHTSHPTMPNFILDPNKIDDLSTYILSLKSSSEKS